MPPVSSPPPSLTRDALQGSPTAAPGRRLLARAADECGAAEATFWLISADRQRMEGTLNHGQTPQVLESLAVPITQSVVGMVASTGVGASIGPDDYHHPVATDAGAADTLAMIAAPVYVRGNLVGVVSAINPRGRERFAAEELETLSFSAYLIGLVLADTANPHADAR